MDQDPGDPQTTRRIRTPQGDRPGIGARLVVIHGAGMGSWLELMHQPVTIGRSREAGLVIDHGSVSRMHCMVWNESGQFHIRDLGSTNKTLVNSLEVESGPLKDGDTIAIGEVVLKFFRRESMEDKYHQAMVEMASVDALTQLPNRRSWRESLERAMVAALDGPALSLVFIDLDHFKRVNDELGHLAGDEVLKAVGAAIQASLGHQDIAGRLGGEEFAVIMPGASLAQAEAYGERLRRAVELLSVATPAGPRSVTTSLGVVQWSAALPGSADFMRAADAELFRAKSEGRNRVCARRAD